MELEPGNPDFVPRVDPRRHMPEPPPVKIIGVGDVHLPAARGQEAALEGLYCGLLGFWRLRAEAGSVGFRAENADLLFDLHAEQARRPDMRATGIVVPSLDALRQKLIDADIEHVQDRGLAPGEEVITLRDPAGNWLAIREERQVG